LGRDAQVSAIITVAVDEREPEALARFAGRIDAE
jgi:hypothetical protein